MPGLHIEISGGWGAKKSETSCKPGARGNMVNMMFQCGLGGAEYGRFCEYQHEPRYCGTHTTCQVRAGGDTITAMPEGLLIATERLKMTDI